MNLSPGRKRISEEERPKRIADRRCLDGGGSNHRAAEHTVKKITLICENVGAEVRKKEPKQVLRNREKIKSGNAR
jgi:hypothetical protein